MTLQRTRTYECMCLLDNREVRKGWQPLKDSVLAMFGFIRDTAGNAMDNAQL